MYVETLNEAIALLYVAFVILQQEVNVEHLAELFFEKLREQEIVFDFFGKSNWLPVNKVMCKVRIFFRVPGEFNFFFNHAGWIAIVSFCFREGELPAIKEKDRSTF
jgi:hypothetical protein